MTKAEIFYRLYDYLVDEGRDDPEEYLDLDLIELDYAKVMLNDIRTFEDECDLEDDERLVPFLTPELVMELYNNLIRAKKHEARIKQIAEYFEDHPDFLVYSYSYLPDCHPVSAPNDMVPLDFFTDELEEGGFYFDTNDRTFTKEEVLRIFANSLSSMDMDDPYICFHDYGNVQKMLTFDDPTEAVDVEDFATLIVDSPESLALFVNEVVDDDDLVKDIFNCTKEELLK